MKLFVLLIAALVAEQDAYTMSDWKGYGQQYLKKVAIGEFGVWGLDASNNVYYKTDADTFASPPSTGTLVDIAVGGNQVWGINPSDHIYRKIGSANWEQISGVLVQLSVSDNNHVWGVNRNNHIYRRNGNNWTQVPGVLVCVSVGKSGVWGINSDSNIYYRTGTYGDANVSGNSWQQVQGNMKWISSGDGIVVGVNGLNEIYYRAGISASNPTGNTWERIPGNLEQIDTWNDQVWGRNINNQPWSLTFGSEPCQLTRIEILSTSQERTFVGTKVIGISSAGSCFGSGSGSLSLTHTSSVEESIGIELSEESGIDWSVSASVEVTAGFEVFGVSGEVSVGLEVGAGGSKSYGKTDSSSTTTSVDTEVGHTMDYTSPGAALIVGTVDKYATNNNLLPVKQHFRCSSGSTYTRDSTIRLTQQHYEAAHFEELRGTFYRDACVANSYSLPDCVRLIKTEYNGFLGDLNELRLKFAACFADGKGIIAKKRE